MQVRGLLPSGFLQVTTVPVVLGITILAATAVACGSTSVTEVAGPSARCDVGFSAPVDSVSAVGATVNASVSLARECAWTASSDASWLQISPASGQGEAAVVLTVVENPIAQARSGTLTVNDRRVSVVQQAADCYFQFDPPAIFVEPGGANQSLAIKTRVGCAWSAATSESWIRVVPSSGSGPVDARIDVDQNGPERRGAQLTIAGHLIRIEQKAADPDPPESPAPKPVPAPAPKPLPLPRRFPLRNLRRFPLRNLRRFPLRNLRRFPLRNLRRLPLRNLRRRSCSATCAGSCSATHADAVAQPESHARPG